MNFLSDNVSGASPEIIAAIGSANSGSPASYGGDQWTKAVEGRLKEIFEVDLAAFPIVTGTAANALSLSLLSPPWGAIYCHKDAHVSLDECGAPEFFTGGAKLVGLPGAHGKLDAAELATALRQSRKGVVHHAQAAAVSITQATEAGTCYRADQVGAVAEVAKGYGLGVHMDGARFANALVHVRSSPADLTWKAGVDVLSFGATKNGALAAEVVILFDTKCAPEFLFRCKQSGHLLSKMRFISSQLGAYLENDLWLKNAARANATARLLGEGLSRIPGAALIYPIEANEIFVDLPERVIGGLAADGFLFYRVFGEDRTLLRLVTSHITIESDVSALIACAWRHSAKEASG